MILSFTHNKEDLTLLSQIYQINPDLYYVPIWEKYSPFDLIALAKNKVAAIFELKRRSKEKGATIKKKGTFLVDWQKIESLAAHSKKMGCKAFLVQQIDGSSSFYLFEAADQGIVSPGLVKVKMWANSKTAQAAPKVKKALGFYKISDCLVY